jgi:two-component system nitrogen regulation response regulator NtrX
MAADILVVDDEADIREIVAGILDDEGYSTRKAGDSDSALAAISARRPSMVFLDIWLQGSRLDGLALLDEISGQHPDLPVVIISGHGNVETAVSAIKRGAYDYIEKPFKADRLVLVAARALEAYNLKREVAELKQRSGDSEDLVGSSGVMSHMRQTIERVSPTNSRIMIFGPSGSGKEQVARAIHSLSNRSKGPFVVLNAAAITPERMEVELFGTEPLDGAARRVGALEEAHGGTLYLDEIADMPRETQNKILRVLVDQTFERVGGTNKVKVDVRILSSTARDLETAIGEGKFREDLFHRLSVVPLRIPALAERREDIPELVAHFMGHVSSATGLPIRRIGDDAMAVLQAHDWPGQPPSAAQQRRALDDPDARRSGSGDFGRHAAQGDRRDPAVHPGPRRRAHHVAAAARSPRGVRAGVPDCADQPLQRQHLAHCRVRRHGALRFASQAEEPRRLERMSRIAYVNGRYVPHSRACVHIEDRGYQFADGVYEVCEVWKAHIVDETRHLDRLERSLGALSIRLPMPHAAIRVVLREVIRRNRVFDGLVYLQVTRGVARRDHAFPPASTPPALVRHRQEHIPCEGQPSGGGGGGCDHPSGQPLGTRGHQKRRPAPKRHR